MNLDARITALAQAIGADIKALFGGKVDKTAVQTSQQDRTSNALMTVGAFGIGKLLDLRSSTFSGATPPSYFFGAGTVVGFIAGGPGASASQLGLEIPALAGARNYGVLTTHGHWTDSTGGGGVQQIFVTGARTFTRLPISSTTWADWREMAYADNAVFTGNGSVTGSFSAGTASPMVISGSLGGTVRHSKTASGGQMDIDDLPFTNTDAALVRFHRYTSTSGAVQVTFLRGSGENIADHYFASAGTNDPSTSRAYLCGGGGKAAIGVSTPDSTATLLVGGPLKSTGAVSIGQFTVSTRPSAAAYNSYELDVTDLPGGPQRQRSNGLAWLPLNVGSWAALPLTAGATGAASYPPQYRMVGDTVELRGKVTLTAALAANTAFSFATLPSAFVPGGSTSTSEVIRLPVASVTALAAQVQCQINRLGTCGLASDTALAANSVTDISNVRFSIS